MGAGDDEKATVANRCLCSQWDATSRQDKEREFTYF